MTSPHQITLDKKTPRYYTDFGYQYTINIVEQIKPVYDKYPDKIRIGKRFTITDIKKRIVKPYSFYYMDDNYPVIEDNFGWLKPNDAKEVSDLLNKKGRHTVIVRDMGGSGISGIHSVILVERPEDLEVD